ncbi:hypothetical protein GCM10010406_08110 [Streptomyces thermolineatus]|uniref:Uncharacterized protein n=1 Tax=Streptomyces thermolineatus TaxID=44033 RepID=A0ABN3KYC8_9ACTN
METELAALAASGATTLVGLMVSDSWTHVRDRLGHFLARDRGTEEAAEDLDTSRRELVAAHEAGDAPTAAGVAADWQTRLLRLLRADPAAAGELRRLLDSLDAPSREQQPPAVHNTVSGGTQYGPVIQSGRITGLVLHDPGTAPTPDGPGTGGKG